MPAPNSGEKKSSYISRCIKKVMDEGNATQEQAQGKCYGLWDNYNSKKNLAKNLVKVIQKAFTFKARTIEGFESPEPGDLPEEGKKLLAKVYAECRKSGKEKESCAKIAWSAVENSGYKSGKSEIQKTFDSIDKILKNDCGCDKK